MSFLWFLESWTAISLSLDLYKLITLLDDKYTSSFFKLSKEIPLALKHKYPYLFILLESNYDPEVLRCSAYPFNLKSRIAGPIGHLPNEMAGKTISHLLKSGLKTAMLGHLSKESNFPELAYQTVAEELMNANIDMGTINLSVASRENPSKVINIK